MATELETDERVAAKPLRRRLVLVTLLVVAALAVPYGWLRVQTQTITVIAEAGPVRPGEQITVDITGSSVLPLIFGFEQAPLGRWFMTHDGSGRVRDNWYWPIGREDRSTKLPDSTSSVTVAAPDDATGSKFAICDIDDNCVVLRLDHP